MIAPDERIVDPLCRCRRHVVGLNGFSDDGIAAGGELDQRLGEVVVVALCDHTAELVGRLKGRDRRCQREDQPKLVDAPLLEMAIRGVAEVFVALEALSCFIEGQRAVVVEDQQFDRERVPLLSTDELGAIRFFPETAPVLLHDLIDRLKAGGVEQRDGLLGR